MKNLMTIKTPAVGKTEIAFPAPSRELQDLLLHARGDGSADLVFGEDVAGKMMMSGEWDRLLSLVQGYDLTLWHEPHNFQYRLTVRGPRAQ